MYYNYNEYLLTNVSFFLKDENTIWKMSRKEDHAGRK